MTDRVDRKRRQQLNPTRPAGQDPAHLALDFQEELLIFRRFLQLGTSRRPTHLYRWAGGRCGGWVSGPVGPQPGEDIDSYLRAYARLLHAEVSDILALAGLTGRPSTAKLANRPWTYRLDSGECDALAGVTGLPAQVLTAMTLARYDAAGLLSNVRPTGQPRPPPGGTSSKDHDSAPTVWLATADGGCWPGAYVCGGRRASSWACRPRSSSVGARVSWATSTSPACRASSARSSGGQR